MQKMPFDHETLRMWFIENKRDLPWRRGVSPYGVWISEIMLQQTQVAVVEEYYLRWMERFPTVQSLARASVEEVIKMWEGLGYYSRARHLHQGAHYLVNQHGGQLPSTREELEKVKGLGPYTIGAILSFAFHQKAAAVDGNAIRVLSRYFCLEEDVSLSKVQRRIWQWADALLPKKAPWEIVEGIIELGAVVCQRVPKCLECPLKMSCLGYEMGKQDLLPIKKKRAAVTVLERHVAIVVNKGFILLKKRKEKGLMADLYEFPYFEGVRAGEVRECVQRELLAPVKLCKSLTAQQHHFTRYRATLFPSIWKAEERVDHPEYEWIEWEEVRGLSFSAGHRRILNSLEHCDVHFTY
jgi:A/G-specific adenine glycosylase